jgi:hypothetical protein
MAKVHYFTAGIFNLVYTCSLGMRGPFLGVKNIKIVLNFAVKLKYVFNSVSFLVIAFLRYKH